MKENGIFADSSDPPLEHDLDQTVIFLVSWSGGLSKWQCWNDGLGVAIDDGVVKLLKLQVRARDVAVCRAIEVGEVCLQWNESVQQISDGPTKYYVARLTTPT